MNCFVETCGCTARFLATRFKVVTPLCLTHARDLIALGPEAFPPECLSLIPGQKRAWWAELREIRAAEE